MTKEQFQSQTVYKMPYDEYIKCCCPDCSKTDCFYRNDFKRLPQTDGGLGLCPNLKTENIAKE